MIYTSIVGEKNSPRYDIKVFKGEGLFTSPRMEAKIYKVLFHKFIKDEYSIWVDGNAFLKYQEEYYYDLLGDYDIAVKKHPGRNCVYEEAEACKQRKKDKEEIINKQVKKYKKEGYPADNGLGECQMIVRRNTPEMRRLCEAWWAEICAHSSRDQISFPYIFRDKVKYLPTTCKTPETYISNEYYKLERHLHDR